MAEFGLKIIVILAISWCSVCVGDDAMQPEKKEAPTVSAYWLKEADYHLLCRVWSRAAPLQQRTLNEQELDELLTAFGEKLVAYGWSTDDVIVYGKSRETWIILTGKSDRIFRRGFAADMGRILAELDPHGQFSVMVNFEQEDSREKSVPHFIMKAGAVYLIDPEIDPTLDDKSRAFIAKGRNSKAECDALWSR